MDITILVKAIMSALLLCVPLFAFLIVFRMHRKMKEIYKKLADDQSKRNSDDKPDDKPNPFTSTHNKQPADDVWIRQDQYMRDREARMEAERIRIQKILQEQLEQQRRHQQQVTEDFERFKENILANLHNPTGIEEYLQRIRSKYGYEFTEFLVQECNRIARNRNARSNSSTNNTRPTNHIPTTNQWAYEILEIKIGSSKDEIKSAYRKLSKKYHPDMPTGNKDKFIKLQSAYDELSK